MASAYWALFAGQFRSVTAYRASFALELVSNVGVVVLDVVTVLVLFRVTPSLGGFAVREALLLVTLTAFPFAVADLLVGNIEKVKNYVRTGLLDTVLVRPLGALPQLLLMDLPLKKVLRSVLALAALVVAVRLAGVAWTPARAALLAATVLGAVAFYASIFVAGASVAFWWVESGELANSLTYGGKEFTSYPVTVFEGWFRAVFAYGLGFAFVCYQPALALLGRADPLGLPSWASWAAPLVAVPAVALAAGAWRLGIRHYRSTGS